MERGEADARRHRRERLAAAIAIAAFAVVVVLFIRWNAKEERELAREKTYVPLRETITPEIVELQEYVRIDTTNPPGNELAGARWLAARLAKENISYEIIEAAPGRANLYARLRGKRPGEGLLLLNHIDVVPAERAGWSLPPFAAAIQNNMMFGRGTLDMKSIGICELEAFLALARTKRTPERDVVFLAVADEETGGSLGTAWLLDHRPDVFAGIRYAINEGGVTESVKDEPTYFGIELGSKQLVTVKLRSASRDALVDARFALEPYLSTHEPQRLLPEVRRYLAEIAPRRLRNRELLADMDRTVREEKAWLLEENYRMLLVDAIVAEGVVPDGDGWAMTVHFSNLPDTIPEQKIDWLRSVVAPYHLALEVLKKDGPVPLTSADTPFFRLLADEIHRSFGAVPVGTQVLVGSATDSRYLRKRGIDCYGIWPFPVTVMQSASLHHTDERIRLDWFQQGVGLTKNLVLDYANGR